MAALPFTAAVVAALVVGRSADRSHKHKLHACGAFLAAGALLALGTIPGQPLATMLASVTLAGAAVYAWVAPFWVLPTLALKEDAAAASIGFINSVGNFGGFLGPFVIGFLLSRGWPPATVMLVPAAAYFASAALAWSQQAERR